MAYFCGKCGSRLDAETGLCPKCNKPKHPFRTVVLILLAVLLVMGAGVALIWNRTVKQSEPSTPTVATETTAIIQNTELFMTETIPVPTVATEEERITETSDVQETQSELVNSEEKLKNFVTVYTQYMPIIENIKATAIDPEHAVGQLCDMNSDGIPELAISYYSPAPYPINKITSRASLQCIVCELYTIKDGQVFPLLAQEMLSLRADGCYGKFAFSEMGGNICFAIHGKAESNPLQKAGLDEVDQILDEYLEDVWKFGLGLKKNDQRHYDKGKIKVFTLEGYNLDCRSDTRYRYDSDNKEHSNGITTVGEPLTEDTYKMLSELPWVECNAGTPLEDLFPYSAGNCGSQVDWILDETGILTIFGTGAMPDFEYFEENNRPSTDSPWDAFRKDILSVKIGSGITRIGEHAFEFCSNMRSIDIPESVTSIGTNSFRDCNSLLTVTLPSGLTQLEKEMFYHCDRLENVNLPKNMDHIMDGAFRYCGSLGQIYIPESVTPIGEMAFYGTQLKTVTINRNSQLGYSVFPEYCEITYY